MAIYGHRTPKGKEKEKKEENTQMPCLIIYVCVLPQGSLNLGKIYK